MGEWIFMWCRGASPSARVDVLVVVFRSRVWKCGCTSGCVQKFESVVNCMLLKSHPM